ncbi:hypothetical protein [Scytonema sp. PRP1]|uniref:hypothetical protein n=1 Tax=Scytonema sp. PRP1 TaxID=3120513 RepID=UPI00300D9C42
MENKEAKKASESEVSGDTINDTNVVEEPVVANSTDLQDGRGNSRSPGKDRGGDSFARLVPDSARGAAKPSLGGA